MTSALAAKLNAADASVTNRRKPLVTSVGTPPTTAQDSGAGYAVGDVVENAGALYVCASAAASAAVWIRLGLTATQLSQLTLAASSVQPAALLPPVDVVQNSANTLALDMNHHLKVLHSTHATPVLQLRAQSAYTWGSQVLLNLTSAQNFKVSRPVGVSVNGNTAGTDITCTGGVAGITLIRHASDTWWISGAATF